MTEILTSLQNPRVKLAHTLQQKARARRGERKIVLEGTRLIRDALQQGSMPEFVFYDLGSMDYDLLAELQTKKITVIPAAPEVMKHISDTQNPQGAIGVFPLPYPPLPRKPERALILDAIREPGNMGTILRTAAASGVDAVILAPDCVDPYNPKVLRAGMGAHFRVAITEAPWGQIKGYLDDVPVYLAAGDGDTSYSDVDWKKPWALVIGNEAHGVGQESGGLQGTRIAIPMASNSESINAAVATGVILFEAQRQRLNG